MISYFFSERTRIPKTLTESVKDVQETRSYIRTICFLAVLAVIICIRCNNFCNTDSGEYVNMKFISSEEANVTMYELYLNRNNSKIQDVSLPICYYNTTGLAEITVNKTIIKYVPQEVYPSVNTGGYYRPEDCKPRHKIAILIPYRNRERNLMIFLYNIHSFLIRQKLEYMIFVIEQIGTDDFNRGKLFNAGFLEMKKFGEWRCVIFHDVDLLPLDDRILYSCPTWPRHMCATVVEVKNPKFRTLFGGVSAMDVKHFDEVNGYSNLYWGWGGEDNDMFRRIRASELPVVRNSKSIGRYTSLEHSKQSPNPLR
ncbi:unnamed protein product [Euphydryas editha]|uniref:Beta-1,4-N-acetylgalactosaminyltransferase n=1 Tax=Euphydryas editha TaxID=104508 RepID=A0AAU9U3M4_EUPED|nr:unnamed protein product [Euphydryas editha]